MREFEGLDCDNLLDTDGRVRDMIVMEQSEEKIQGM